MDMTVEEFKEKKRLVSQAWREANRERHREYQRAYRMANLAESKERNKKWAKDNPERVSESQRKSRTNNPEIYRAITQRYRNSHPGFSAHHCRTRRARRKGASGNITRFEWRFVVRCFGGRCAKCGTTEKLSLDHIVPLVKGGSHTLDNAQPLCVPCNSSKHAKTIDYRLSSPWFNKELYERGPNAPLSSRTPACLPGL